VTGKVRIGLAGLGRMGRIHAANLAFRCPSAELACVFDLDGAAAREVIEYDNVRDGANHVHSVWRDPQGDFGQSSAG
jgi:6-phosphogluconate dehydrogenase (decarboxylating)